ncbi:hypothetical protein ACFV06_20420 [Streptomyces sp. NPDC059618]|uniref:hypothetical protein n=1 Tax=Streptomyces sp. NPDC059618 TaxID=3346887 RepID=UPI0036C4E496
MGTDEQVCPACGQPVATVVHRYKTLGAWVPRWGPGPCRNPDCADFVHEPGHGQAQAEPQAQGQVRAQAPERAPEQAQALPEETAAEKP